MLKNEADIAFLGRQAGGIDSFDFHCSAVGNFQTRNDPQQRRLPSAARPEQSGQFACRDIEVDVLQRHQKSPNLLATPAILILMALPCWVEGW